MASLNELFILRIASPSLVILAVLALFPSRAAQPPSSSSPITSVVVKSYFPRRALILSFLSLASLSFLADGLTFVIYAVLSKIWPKLSAIEISAILGIVGYGGLAALGAYKDIKGVNVWSFKFIKLAIASALALDIAQVILLALALQKCMSRAFSHSNRSANSSVTVAVQAILHLAFPSFRVLVLVPLVFALYYPRVEYTPVEPSEDVIAQAPTQSSYLLAPESHQASTGLNPVSGKYGTFRSGRSLVPASGPNTRTTSPVAGPGHVSSSKKEEISYDPSWKEIRQRLKHLTPYLWPSTSRPLQFIAAVCILLLIIGRVVNVFLPLTLGRLIRTFENHDGTSYWPYLLSYIGLQFLQSNGGIAALRDSLWAPVMQYSDRAMSQLAFDHLLNLSLSFHIRRKTGEVLRILDRGAAINHTLELILFSIVPTFVDIIVALVVFAVLFEWTLTVVIFLVMFAYISASVVLTQWRTKIRRQMNEKDIVTRGIHTDCLLNYETVKYFGGEQHEGERYRAAIREYQALEYKVIVSLNLLNLVQNLITMLGLLVGSIIMASRVVDGRSHPSDFVFFIAYLAQLYTPLNMLGTIYRSINTSLVDTERLLKLLNEPTDVNDKPNAPDLIVIDGEIEFDNVSFSYDGRTPALSGISFKVPKGSAVALVGESGSGKSTILRLLYRFYDLKEGQGRILIDGQDIRDVTQASLRKAIGVVPQDSVLFNASIGYNIGYGKFGASQDEIIGAAKAAQMHERIMSFPDGYDTKVGERGVRLSGGEKQRVAIARTLLKNPPVLLLDEATSALDTSTEKDIQNAFENLVQGRSSLSIAHRLSTIANSDMILVLKDGQILESGTQKELLALDGMFTNMWNDQMSASDQASITKRQSVSGYEIGESETAGEMDDVKEEDTEQAVGVFGQAIPVMPDSISVVRIEAADDFIPVPAETLEVEDLEEAPRETVVFTEEPVSLVEFPAGGDSESVVAPSVSAPAPPPKDDTTTTSAPPVSPAVSFPGMFSFPGGSAGDQDSRAPSISDVSRPGGVTFEAQSPPSRTGTPDPDADATKRKRTASQNFQRLARRISVSTRKGSGSSSGGGGGGITIGNMNVNMPSMNLGSMGIPGFKREGSSKKEAKDKDKDMEAEGGSSRLMDSPAPGLTGGLADNRSATPPPLPKGSALRKKQEKRKTLG